MNSDRVTGVEFTREGLLALARTLDAGAEELARTGIERVDKINRSAETLRADWGAAPHAARARADLETAERILKSAVMNLAYVRDNVMARGQLPPSEVYPLRLPPPPPPPPPPEEKKGFWDRALNVVQTGLDVAGLVPGVGEIADGTNALIYLARGDEVNAALSAAAMIPIGGQAATAAKYALRYGDEALAVGQQALRHGDEAAAAGQAARRSGSAGDAVRDPSTGRLRDPQTGRFVSDPANPPSPYTFNDTQRRAEWRRLADDPHSPLTAAQREEIVSRGGRGPQRVDPNTGELETMELSHEPIPLREGGTDVVPRWPDEHAAIDPHRRLRRPR